MRVNYLVTAFVFVIMLILLSINVCTAAIPLAERNALIALYNSTNGDGWMNNTGWKDGLSFNVSGTEGSWYGVVLNSDNTHVIKINLYDNLLAGSIPVEIGNFSNLQELWLKHNQLSGNIPAEIGNLTKLESLKLNENQLSGNIPVEFGNIANLRELFLDSNQLSGSIPVVIMNLSNLRDLFLEWNNLSGSIPVEIGNLTNLEDLRLGGNQLTGNIPEEIGNLSNLEDLWLFDNDFSGNIPVTIGNLTNLRGLSFGWNDLSGSIPIEIGNLINLESLWLQDNDFSGPIPEELGSIPSLQQLNLEENELSGSIPSTLMNLTNLFDGYSDFRWNFLYTDDDTLRDFLNTKQIGGNWESYQYVAGPLYDDFSDQIIDNAKWEQVDNTKEVYIADGKVNLFFSGYIDSSGNQFVNLPFKDPASVNAIKATVSIKETSGVSGLNGRVHLLGNFYADQYGDVRTAINLSDRGNGLEAWWYIESINSMTSLGSGTLQTNLQYDTAYELSLSYDETNNMFTFSIDGISVTASGVNKQGNSSSEWKTIDIGVLGEPNTGPSSVSATIDNVYINNETTPYDQFSQPTIDTSKWNTSTSKRTIEVKNNGLNLFCEGYGKKTTTSISPTQNDFSFIEASVTVHEQTSVSQGGNGKVRLGKTFYNDSYGPGSGQGYNGYLGNIYSEVKIILDEDNQFKASAIVTRSDDPNWDTETILFLQDFLLPIQKEEIYILSLEFTGSQILFRCNDEKITYNILTPIYEPENEDIYISSRVYLDPGEHGVFDATVDDVNIIRTDDYIPPTNEDVIMPDVVGMAQSLSESTISAAGLTLGNISMECDETISAGEVVSSIPAAGTAVSAGTLVSLVISTGLCPDPVYVPVPVVVGMTQTSSELAITDSGLIVGEVFMQCDDTTLAYEVISSTPGVGTSVVEGSSVNLVVSTGPCPEPVVSVPDVVGIIQNLAESAITAAGLTVGNVSMECDDTISAGEVISSNPAAGISVSEGTSVELVVSAGPCSGSNQDNIESIQSTNQEIITLQSSAGTTLSNCQSIDNPSSDNTPTGVDFPYGLFSFVINDVTPGGSTTMTITLPVGANPTTYYKYGPTPNGTTDHWYEFMYDGETGAVINGNVITLTFVDGKRGDSDLAENGIIVDPGAPALSSGITAPTNSGSSNNDSGGGGSSGSCFIGSLTQ